MMRVFISHSRTRDEGFFMALRESLEKLGNVEILDPMKSAGFSSDIASEVRAQIERCDVAIAMIGPDRPNILLETGMALGAGKDVLLVAASLDSLPLNVISLPVVVRSGDLDSDVARVSRIVAGMRQQAHADRQPYHSAFDALMTYQTDPRFFDAIPPRSFEQLIARLFEEQGYEVALTRGTADAGFDMFVNSPRDHRRILVEVKKYGRQSRVSIGAVQGLLGASVLNSADIAVLVTSSSFTSGAEAMALRSKHPRLILVTMDRLLSVRAIDDLLGAGVT